MSTRTESYTASSSGTTGLPKGIIPLLAALFIILFSAIDINYHGHFSCKTIAKVALAQLDQKTHLKGYMADQKDFAGQPEEGTVKVECLGGRKLVLTGKVVNEDLRQEFSDVVADAVGTDRVDNQIEVLNEPALRELQALLAAQPTGVTMNYQVKERGTIYLTGDLPNPELKDQITKMVARIRGVRSVVNDMGKEIQVQRMIRIHNIYFDFNQWLIRPQSKPALDEVAQKIEEYFSSSGNGTIRIEGHTDTIANNQYNQWLSEKRAQAVLEALVSLGIPRDRMKAVGKGESQTLAMPDDTPEKRAENRRIEFYFE